MSPWEGWVLLDREGKLIALDELTYRGVSPRKFLPMPAQRLLLLPRLMTALTSKVEIPVDTEHLWRGKRYRTRVRPLKAPYSGEVVGSMGRLFDAVNIPAAEPTVGCWEWIVSPGGSNLQPYWDHRMYTLYGVQPEVVRNRGAFAPPEWFYKVVSPQDSARLYAMITKGIVDVAPGLHTIVYRITTGYATERESSKLLRLAGRVIEDPDGTVRLSGISHEVSDRVEEWTPGLEDETIAMEIAAAAMRLGTSALCLLDVDSGQLLASSEHGWQRARIISPTSGMVSDFVAPGAVRGLLQHLRQGYGASRNVDGVGSYITYLLTEESSIRRYTARMIAVHSKSKTPRYAVVEFCPL